MLLIGFVNTGGTEGAFCRRMEKPSPAGLGQAVQEHTEQPRSAFPLSLARPCAQQDLVSLNKSLGHFMKIRQSAK